jgi:hypothetical protein
MKESRICLGKLGLLIDIDGLGLPHQFCGALLFADSLCAHYRPPNDVA